ncbi:MAG: hypothetical protein QOF10_50 [Kribbellaceae bacterium]|jgi:hypothetical protein|nr:hypothetical protein [Kribbellaceae bacterium]
MGGHATEAAVVWNAASQRILLLVCGHSKSRAEGYLWRGSRTAGRWGFVKGTA